METTAIVILASSVSLIITLFVNWYLHNKDYKNEYNKRLIDIRLKAYELVETLVYRIRTVTYPDINNKDIVYLEFMENWSEFDKVYDLLHQIGQNSFIWLPIKTQNAINLLQKFLTDYVDNQRKVIDCEKLGLKYHYELNCLRRNIVKYLYSDLKRLYKLEFPKLTIDKQTANQLKIIEQSIRT